MQMILPWCLDYSKKLTKIRLTLLGLPYTNIEIFEIYFFKQISGVTQK